MLSLACLLVRKKNESQLMALALRERVSTRFFNQFYSSEGIFAFSFHTTEEYETKSL